MIITSEQKEHFHQTKTLVENWARENVPTELSYNSRSTYWRSAMLAGIINQEQYDFAGDFYGNLWFYTGD